jgi:hypothetical protein
MGPQPAIRRKPWKRQGRTTAQAGDYQKPTRTPGTIAWRRVAHLPGDQPSRMEGKTPAKQWSGWNNKRGRNPSSPSPGTPPQAMAAKVLRRRGALLPAQGGSRSREYFTRNFIFNFLDRRHRATREDPSALGATVPKNHEGRQGPASQQARRKDGRYEQAQKGTAQQGTGLRRTRRWSLRGSSLHAHHQSRERRGSPQLKRKRALERTHRKQPAGLRSDVALGSAVAAGGGDPG